LRPASGNAQQKDQVGHTEAKLSSRYSVGTSTALEAVGEVAVLEISSLCMEFCKKIYLKNLKMGITK
jgi:hypothetical protein